MVTHGKWFRRLFTRIRLVASIGADEVFALYLQVSELSPPVDPPPLVNYARHGSTGMMPAAPNLKRQKMIYHMKFGDYGTDEGHFTEPSGVAVGSVGQIIVADTNNHRMQVCSCRSYHLETLHLPADVRLRRSLHADFRRVVPTRLPNLPESRRRQPRYRRNCHHGALAYASDTGQLVAFVCA